MSVIKEVSKKQSKVLLSKYYQPLTMNNSRSNRKCTLQGCTSNIKTSNLSITKSEDNKITVNYSFDFDDTSGCQEQSKRLHKSENDSEVLAPPRKRIKIAQNLTIAETDKLKQHFDNGTCDSQEDDGTCDTQEDDGTNYSQEDDDTHYSQEDDGIDDSQEDDDTDDAQDDDGTDDSQEDDDTDDAQDDDGTDDSQEDDDSNDGHKDSCNKKDEADLFYGTHETQVSEGGELDLHKHLVGCKKNPGHTKFVPVNDFDINHLLEGHHDNDLVELIKATADLTVRVAVKKTSSERPEFWPDTKFPYAFYDMRESDVMRIGTGLVWNVIKWTEEGIKEYNLGTCKCHKCEHTENTPSKVWGVVEMMTATHVVFDDIEARHTTCRLFYDRQDSPLITVDGWTVDEANIEEDRCRFQCVTCDIDLLDKLYKMVDHWRDQWEKVNNKYESSRDEVKLTFIVSHPHGCSKQISIGHWIKRYVVDYDDDDDDYGTRYTYTTCTCPGSSGARVHPLGNDEWGLELHVHSGVNSKGNNFCTAGRDFN